MPHPLLLAALLSPLVAEPLPSGRRAVVDNCDVFCRGPLLDAVQRAHVFQDSKHFVDMTLRHDPNVTVQAFLDMSNRTDPDAILAFLSDHFDAPGSELELCDPVDWQPRPASFELIRDPYYRLWAIMINQKWHKLCRRVKDEVHENPQRYSLIPVPRPFIVPGGRFRELYYWDTYWVIRGLLASGMPKTAADMIVNLASMIERYGFVPNGNRIYYLDRSHPPLLTRCVYDYFNATGDVDLVRAVLPLLESEYDFWLRERSVAFPAGDNGDVQVRLFQYRTSAGQPRAESYREDLQTTQFAPTIEGKRQMWSDIRAGCESGWDFTSRWFGRTGVHKYTMRSIRTSRVVPVDLNAFICGNHRLLSELYAAVGNESMAEVHRKSFTRSVRTMSRYFWDPIDRMWYDLDLDSGARVANYYASNMAPLWTGCFEPDDRVAGDVVSYLRANEILDVPHGLPTSLTWTDEQWDRPNGWAPTNHMLIEGLRLSGHAEAERVAFELAEKWLKLNFAVYLRSGGKMFEKYNVEDGFAAGGGGEYDVQEGFGWTNGVALDLLIAYGDRLTMPFVAANEIVQGVFE